MSDDLRCDKHPERRVPCFLCVSKSLDEWPLSKSGMTATECLALIERTGRRCATRSIASWASSATR